MPATILLIRHAAHSRVDSILCGRMQGVGLGPAGKQQAAALAAQVLVRPVDAVYSSPLQRTRETAQHFADDVRISDAVTEIDFGRWTGQSFSDLASDPAWQRWNACRSTARCPGGESMQEVQQRVTAELTLLAARHQGERIVVVSHGDVIKAALMSLLHIGIDGWQRFEIAPASLSQLRLGAQGGTVVSMNETFSE